MVRLSSLFAESTNFLLLLLRHSVSISFSRLRKLPSFRDRSTLRYMAVGAILPTSFRNGYIYIYIYIVTVRLTTWPYLFSPFKPLPKSLMFALGLQVSRTRSLHPRVNWYSSIHHRSHRRTDQRRRSHNSNSPDQFFSPASWVEANDWIQTLQREYPDSYAVHGYSERGSQRRVSCGAT